MFKLSAVENYSRNMTNKEIAEIYHDGIVEWDPMVVEIAKRTRLPRFLVEMVYAAETKVMLDVGLMK